jgi:nanoRNase/pAp phosphatase (c-di-AMP/oligoRNAs hydrolase)
LNAAVPDLDKLREFLGGRVLLICHHNADPDAVGAAYGVGELARSLDPSTDVVIVTPGGASRLSREVMEKLGIVASSNLSLDGVDAIVVVDTATMNQLDGFGEIVASADVPKLFIDHHSPHPSIAAIASTTIIDESVSSTCEIVHNLYKGLGITPSANVARALLVGIAYDSRHFSIGTSQTLKSASQLLELDGPLGDILSMLSSDRSRSEKIARLKAAQRLKLHEVQGWTVATSNLSSFQASAARALIRLGADVSMVAGKDKGELRASLRASERFYRETSVHLGSDVAKILGDEFSGAGSGHPTAAGVNGKGGLDSFLNRAVAIISLKLMEREHT